MKLTDILFRFGKIQPFYFILSYLIMIVIFATIYFLLPIKSFYHSTSKYEYSILNSEAYKFLTQIKKSILENNEIKNDSIIINKQLSVNISQLRIHSMSVKDFPTHFEFHLNYFLNIKKDSGFIQISQSPIVRASLNNRIIFDNTVILPVEIIENGNGFMNSSFSSNKLFLKYNKNITFKSFNYPHILIDTKLYNELINIGNAYNGYPNDISGHWIRMLYLSMGISTSTIFGDIVPLSSLSRFLVSFQGFLSILIISLFFNSIASNIGKNMKIEEKRINNGTTDKKPVELSISENIIENDNSEYILTDVNENMKDEKNIE